MTSPESALDRALVDACLGQAAGDALVDDLPGFLASHGVASKDVEAIVHAPAHLAVYRSLVRNGLSSVVLRMLPRTRARMNAACAGRFDADFARFVDEAGPRTHYLRDVPAELFAWAKPRCQQSPEIPEYLIDLAEHELAGFALAAADETGATGFIGDVALDRSLVFGGSMQLLRYAWAVHELPDDEAGRDVPERRDVHLLAYRDSAHHVRWLELTPLAATIVRKLEAGEALGAAITGACAEYGAPTDPEAIATLLADLGERGVLLGARAEEP
jgi:hypothetical protein